MTDLTTLSLCEMREGLAARSFSSKELTSAALEKIEKHQNLNSFISICADAALETAERCDRQLGEGKREPLLGIPGAIKDMILTEGVTTTAASKILSNFNPPYSATVVEKLKSAGYVMLGKTNLDEFAMGSSNENSHFNPARNPWNPELVPGGSSGGSAAAVAARLAPFALGTDTGGSIRQPAAFCSLVGLKPTYGRVSRYGVIAFASSLDQVGAFTRDVRDCALVTQIISGHDRFDSTSVTHPVPDFSAVLGQDIKGLRIGLPKEYFIKGIDPVIEQAVRAAARKMEDLGATVVDITLPHTELGVAAYYILAPAEASSNLARYDGVRYGYRTEKAKSLDDLYCRSRSEGFGAEVKRRIMIGTYVLSSGYYDAYYVRAQKVRTLMAKDFADAFTACDLIVCPTTPTPPFKIGAKTTDPLAMYLNDVFTIPVNLAGLPGMSMPCGFTAEGLPIGLQLIGKPWDEETIFKAAFAYEQATEWHRRAPQGFA